MNVIHLLQPRRGPGFAVKIMGALLAGLALVSTLQAQNGPDQEKIDRSYAYGLVIGSDLRDTGIEFDYSAFTQGLRDSLEGLDSRITVDEAILLVQEAYQAAMERRIEENRLKEILFLEENGKRQGVLTTESGLQYEAVQRAGGEKPGPRAVVRVHYEGKFVDGTIFDSSYERGEPAEIPLDRVIPGWTEGLQLMGVGDTFTLYLPSRLAYGENGGGTIPPYSPLIFKVELLDILVPEENPGP
jgi:FKBP-type peptidyl-prolyl cis-trans isomerase